MSGRRLIAILVGVVGLLILAVVVLSVILQDGDSSEEVAQATFPAGVEATTPEPGVTPTATVDPNIRMVEVVVSLQTVPRGWQISG